MSARIIDGKAIAARVRTSVGERVAAFSGRHGFSPGLAVVLVGDDPASAVYVRNKQRACDEVGMESQGVHLPADTPHETVLEAVKALNADPAIHGILVQLPLPEHVDSDEILLSVDPAKDVDGLHPHNLGLLVSGRPRFVPATPSGVRRILLEEGVPIDGADVVICGRSSLVGRPLAELLSQRGEGGNATVTLCHTRTKDLEAVTRRADILVAAMGNPGVIRKDMVKPGAVVIDVGTSRVDDPTRKRGYRLAGDVDFDQVCQVASAVTPVPGGVGPLTIAMLLENCLHAARLSAGAGLKGE